MESIRIPYKRDVHGNDVFAQVSWTAQLIEAPRPIALAFHAGGLLVGSSDIIPQAQIDYLIAKRFVVVAPNYRLCPQVTAEEAFSDCEAAYDWVICNLGDKLSSAHGIELDISRIVTFGHSSGGTIALHVGSRKPNIKGVTAFYPSLYVSDPTTSGHDAYTAPPLGTMPDFIPNASDWDLITPLSHQVSEAPLARPGTIPPPRNKWQMHLLKTGTWLSTVCPDGDYTTIDPLTTDKLWQNKWPAVMIVQGDVDKVPGCGLDLAQRAVTDLQAVVGSPTDVAIEVVPGADHMFDLMLAPQQTGQERRWEAVVKGLSWLVDHV